MESKALPKRTAARLQNYDYSQSGCYFVTVCVKDRKPILCKILPNPRVGTEALSRVGTDVPVRPPYKIKLTQIGFLVQDTIEYIDKNYENVNVDKYCIMPDHVHFLLTIQASDGRGRPSLREDSSETDRAQMTLSRTIRQFKTFTTKQARQIVGNQELLLWQSRFYDHIIRNDEDYAEKWQYIDENPLKYIYLK